MTTGFSEMHSGSSLRHSMVSGRVWWWFDGFLWLFLDIFGLFCPFKGLLHYSTSTFFHVFSILFPLEALVQMWLLIYAVWIVAQLQGIDDRMFDFWCIEIIELDFHVGLFLHQWFYLELNLLCGPQHPLAKSLTTQPSKVKYGNMWK